MQKKVKKLDQTSLLGMQNDIASLEKSLAIS